MSGAAEALLDALPQPLLEVGPNDRISFVNQAAEAMMQSSRAVMMEKPIADFLPFSTPVAAMIEQARRGGGPIREHLVDLSSPRIGRDVLVNVEVAPVLERPNHVLLLLQTRSVAEKLDRQRKRSSRFGTVGDGAGQHVGARNQESAGRHSWRGAAPAT